MSGKIPVGILGATGTVGQRFIQLLEGHPWFEVTWLAASDRSAGKTYAEATKWRLNTPRPKNIAEMPVSPAIPEGAPKLVFAALDSTAANELEPLFAGAGCAVVSNSSSFRMVADVPLIIPEVNGDHLKLLQTQKWFKKGGFIVTNPNCSTIGLVMALAPLHLKFGVEKVFVTTMQAVSGAGYPGVASLDILGNVIPHISGEEEKMETESRKLLGVMNGNGVTPAEILIGAHCNRVAVEDGHMESVSIKLRRPALPEEIISAWNEFTGLPQKLRLPNAPEQPVVYEPAQDRPQPRLDIHRGAGMATVVGRLRPCTLFDWKFTVLSHNTIRGAAGAALLNGELLKVLGYIH
ncbi:MAG TPA: aspartate-semialdehyde dehydrogenase [Candidatus Saccharimonadales bacterium]|jgi:aspartate-semialdehyde dehydrogenase|nr:aspartate-semialdehyde dehydrogenase [Candidatus Saccharimonadales bacterium]